MSETLKVEEKLDGLAQHVEEGFKGDGHVGVNDDHVSSFAFFLSGHRTNSESRCQSTMTKLPKEF